MRKSRGTVPRTMLQRRIAMLLFVLVAALSPLAAASAQTPAPPDVVRLRDGTFLRGTIVERSATQVVVMLPTGETRTYHADQVEFAGPDVAPGPAIVQAPAPPRERVARLHVRSQQQELSLQQLQGSATVSVWTGRGVASATIDQFAVVCNAPCDVEIPEGTYQLGVAQGTGGAQRAGRPMDLRGEMTLELGYNDRSLTRLGGWLTFTIGSAAGAALIIGSIFAGPTTYCGRSSCGQDLSVEMLVSGSVVFGASMIVGLIFAFMQDAPSIEVASDGALRF